MSSFDHFWEHARRAEEDVRQNWYRGHPTPDTIGDPWDSDFADAYSAIELALKPFRRTRIVVVPPNIPFVHPYSADTWHQALMFFLNPPHQLYGSEQAFLSPEYQHIKSGALDELRRLESHTDDRDKQPRKSGLSDKSKQKVADRIKHELRNLLVALLNYHYPFGKDPVKEPLTVEQVMELFPDLHWSQPTASRRMGRLFEGGMEGYKRSIGEPRMFKRAFDARTGEHDIIAPTEGDDE